MHIPDAFLLQAFNDKVDTVGFNASSIRHMRNLVYNKDQAISKKTQQNQRLKLSTTFSDMSSRKSRIL